MKIIEVLVIEQEKGLFKEIAHHLPVNVVEGSRFPSLRLEIDPELIIYFYIFDSSVIPPPDFLEDNFLYIKRILILGNETAFRKWNFSDEVARLVEENYEIIPTLLVLVVEPGKRTQRGEVVFDSGLYLGERSRLVSWERGNKEQIGRIWEIFWNPVTLEL